MDDTTITRFFGLMVVVLIAVGMSGLLVWLNAKHRDAQDGPTLGYPPERFPNQALLTTPALAALMATQTRLVAVVQTLPAHGDLAIWVRAFLRELRAIMDTAYQVAAIAQLYEQATQLEPLVAEVQQIEQQVVAHVAHRLLMRDADAHDELLEGRLAALRLCARELAALTQRA